MIPTDEQIDQLIKAIKNEFPDLFISGRALGGIIRLTCEHMSVWLRGPKV